MLAGMSKPRVKRPENRGLIIAVVVAGIAVLGGVHVVMNRDRELADASASVRPLLPEAIQRIAPRSGRSQGGGAGSQAYPGATHPETVWLEMKRNRGAMVGRPEVVRGDLIKLQGKPVRLYGIDQVLGYKHCNANAFGWPCGASPADALRMLLGNRYVACMPAGYNAQGEVVATCNMTDGADLSVLMLERGMATDATNRMDFRMKQAEARKLGYGYWSTLR